MTDNLNKRRIELGITREDIAKILGYTYNRIVFEMI